MPELDDKTQAMVRDAAKAFGKLFINRRDRKAVYRPDHAGDWHWTAVDKPYDMGDFVKHLTGTHCLGTYLLNPDNTVKFMAFDVDVNKEAGYFYVYDEGDPDDSKINLDVRTGNLEAALHDPTDPAFRWTRIVVLDCVRQICKKVRDDLDLVPMTVITGGGAHVLVPFPSPVDAADAKSVGTAIVADLPSITKINNMFWGYGAQGELTIEVFPKQENLTGKDYGNLIRLPYGWHYEAAIRTFSIDPEAFTCPTWDWKKISSLGTLKQMLAKVDTTSVGTV